MGAASAAFFAAAFFAGAFFAEAFFAEAFFAGAFLAAAFFAGAFLFAARFLVGAASRRIWRSSDARSSVRFSTVSPLRSDAFVSPSVT